MLITILTVALLLPAWMLARYLVRKLSPGLTLTLIVGLAIGATFLMPGHRRVPPWAFDTSDQVQTTLYLVSEYAFFTMLGLSVFLAHRLGKKDA